MAHLCEHLMFVGTKNIPHFTDTLRAAGGSGNAVTDQDTTQYDMTVPAVNFEVAFLLARDRMKGPLVTKRKVQTEQQIIIQEFETVYDDDLFAEANIKLYELAFLKHHYSWHPIGRDREEFRKIHPDDVSVFFRNSIVLTMPF